MKKVMLTIALVFSVGCGGFEGRTEMVTADLAAVSQGHKTDIADKPYCEVDFADYELDTRLLAFEITDRGNVGFGFNILNGFFRALGLRIKTERGVMLASMSMSQSLRPSESLAHVTGEGKSSKTEFNFELDALQLGLDIGYFRQTPLSRLTEKTLMSTLQNLKNEMNGVETAWSTRAVHLYPIEQQLIIPTGSVAGIRLGDRFKIFNVDHAWRGVPCESEHLFERKRTTEAIAIAEVTQLDKNASLLTLVDKRTDDPIEYGARVEIESLPLRNKEKGPRALARSVRFRSFHSEKLVVPGGANVDLTPYLVEHTGALLNHYGYYPRN